MLHYKALLVLFSTTSYIVISIVKTSPEKSCDTEWTTWSKCCFLNNVTSRVRTRTSCDYGVHKDYESCLLPPWSEWSSCSKSCGVGGRITRTRLICGPSEIKQIEQKACPKPSDCYGNLDQIQKTINLSATCFFIGKILLFGSDDFDTNTITLEVMDLYFNTSTICQRKLDSFDAVDYQVSTSISGHLNTLPYIQTEKQAFLFLKNGSVQLQKKTESLVNAFTYSSATQWNQSSILVMNTLNTKLITMHDDAIAYVNGPKVKYVPRNGQCVVAINESTLMIVGGLKRAVDTFGFLDLESGQWHGFDPMHPGPSVEKPKCATFNWYDNEDVVFIIGLNRKVHLFLLSQNKWENCDCDFPGYIEKVTLIPAPQNDGILAFSWERE